MKVRIEQLRAELAQEEKEETNGVIETFKELRAYGKTRVGKKMIDAQIAMKANENL